jgi:hypothetical protein
LDEKTTLSSLQERAKKHLGLTQCLYHIYAHTISLSFDFIVLRHLRIPHSTSGSRDRQP